MAGLDIEVPAAEENSGIPPAAAAPAKKKAAVPNQAGLNEWVSSPQFAADREKQIQAYYDQQLARIQAKQDSFSERWGISDIRAKYSAPTAEAQNQRMKMRREELAEDRALEKEVFEGQGNLAQMKQAVQTRKAFTDYLEEKDRYTSLAQKTKDPKQKEQFEQAALAFDKKAQFLDPQTYSAFAEEGRAGLKTVAPESTLARVGPTGKTETLIKGGPSIKNQIDNATLTAQYGISVLGNQGGGYSPAGGGASYSPAGSGGGASYSPAGSGSTPKPVPAQGAPVNAPSGAQPPIAKPVGVGGAPSSAAPAPVGEIPAGHIPIELGNFAQKAPDIYRGPSRFDRAPIKVKQEMDKDRSKEYGSVTSSIQFFDQMDTLINRLLNNQEGIKSATGIGHSTAGLRGDNTRAADSDLETLRGLVSVEALQRFKENSGGVGSMTEKEWPRFESLRGNLSSNQKYGEIINTLKNIKEDLGRSKASMVNKYAQEYGQHPEAEKLLVPKPFSLPQELAQQIPVGKEQRIENPRTRESIVVTRTEDGVVRRVR